MVSYTEYTHNKGLFCSYVWYLAESNRILYQTKIHFSKTQDTLIMMGYVLTACTLYL